MVGDSVKGLPSVAGSFIRHWHDDEGKEVYFYMTLSPQDDDSTGTGRVIINFE